MEFTSHNHMLEMNQGSFLPFLLLKGALFADKHLVVFAHHARLGPALFILLAFLKI